jgi:amidase
VYLRMMVPITAAVMRDADVAAITAAADRLAPDADDAMSRLLRPIALRHRDWILTHEQRERLRAAWAAFFERYDVLLCPIAPVAAVRHDHSEPMSARTVEVDGRARPYTDLLVWPGAVGVAHLPSSAAPVGRTRDGLPVGVQVVANWLEDRSALAFAAHLERLLGGFEPPAGLSKLG